MFLAELRGQPDRPWPIAAGKGSCQWVLPPMLVVVAGIRVSVFAAFMRTADTALIPAAAIAGGVSYTAGEQQQGTDGNGK